MWNDLSFDTFPIFPYRNIPQITAQCGGADSSHCLLKVQAASAGIPVAEQHLPGAAQMLLHMDRRWQQDLLGKALSPNASEPLELWTTPAQTLKPEQTAGHPFHAAQNASQPKEVQVFCCRRMESYQPWLGTGGSPDSRGWARTAKPTSQSRKLRS